MTSEFEISTHLRALTEMEKDIRPSEQTYQLAGGRTRVVE